MQPLMSLFSKDWMMIWPPLILMGDCVIAWVKIFHCHIILPCFKKEGVNKSSLPRVFILCNLIHVLKRQFFHHPSPTPQKSRGKHWFHHVKWGQKFRIINHEASHPFWHLLSFRLLVGVRRNSQNVTVTDVGWRNTSRLWLWSAMFRFACGQHWVMKELLWALRRHQLHPQTERRSWKWRPL